jgi:hypothetical protein
VNWNIFKEIRFYYLLNKDEDFYEVDRFFVHRVRVEDLSLLVYFFPTLFFFCAVV